MLELFSLFAFKKIKKLLYSKCNNLCMYTTVPNICTQQLPMYAHFSNFFVDMDVAVLRSSLQGLTSGEGISVPHGTGLVDVASELVFFFVS